MKLEFKSLNDCKDKFDSSWITDKITEAGLAYLDAFGLFLCGKTRSEAEKRAGRNAITTTQIRNIFTEVKRIETKLTSAEENDDSWNNEFLLLRYKMAYNTARTLQRTQDSRMKEFREIMETAHSLVGGNKKNFKNFVKFFEGTIAYHKVHGGQD